MRLTPFKIYAIKVAVFSSILLYLAIDLFACRGPVWHAVYDGRNEQDMIRNAPASVFGEPITEEQLARHTAEQDLLAGRTQPDPIRRASRIQELVKAAEIRTRTRYNDLNLPSRHEEAAAEVARLASRSTSDGQFEAELASQGYTREGFTARVEVRMRAQLLVERAIAGFCQVADDVLQDLYNELAPQLQIPATRHVRHIFFATLGQAPSKVKARAEAVLQQVEAGEDFATLARRHSEDSRSAPNGGDLGDMPDTPLRPLPEIPLFGADALPAGTPVLVQSAWGWHIILADEVTPARQATFEECRETLRTAYISAQRELASQQFFVNAIKEDRINNYVRINAN